MKKITHISSIVVLTAAMGFGGITVAVTAGEQPVAAQGNVAYDVLSRSRCNHPDRTKCPRVPHRPEQATQPEQEQQQSATPRREGAQYCYRGSYKPPRMSRRC